jgi:hypothetical protein
MFDGAGLLAFFQLLSTLSPIVGITMLNIFYGADNTIQELLFQFLT